MKLNKKSFVLLYLSVLFVFPLAGKEKPQAANAKCLKCHTEVSICGEKNWIDKTLFNESIHGHLWCADCHEILFREDDACALHKDSFSNVNCIARCHQEESGIIRGQSPLNYPNSIHGKAYLEKGLQDAAKCWDCHGKHNIKSPFDLNSRVNRRNISLICSVCHGNFDIIFKYHTHCKKSSLEYMGGVHGKALYKTGLINFAAACTDCHGFHNIKGVKEPLFMAKKPDNCGKCHVLIFEKYMESTHGREALNGNLDAPLCVDCHGDHKILSPVDEKAPTSRRNVSNTCALCHTQPKVMKKFGFTEDEMKSFVQSGHDITIGENNNLAINCTNCHGFHDIRPRTDLRSSINQINLAKTCGQDSCHPRITDKLVNSKIHLEIKQKKSALRFYPQYVFIFIFLALILNIAIWVKGKVMRKRGLIKRLEKKKYVYGNFIRKKDGK